MACVGAERAGQGRSRAGQEQGRGEQSRAGVSKNKIIVPIKSEHRSSCLDTAGSDQILIRLEATARLEN